MKKSIFLLLVTSFTLLWCSYGRADANKVVYELQERCGKTASEFFKQDYGSNFSRQTDGSFTMSEYTNHYNVKLNKCFILLVTTLVQENAKHDKGSLLTKFLFDVNENKQYGNFSKFQRELNSICTVRQKLCNSEAEWDALIKPYMEE